MSRSIALLACLMLASVGCGKKKESPAPTPAPTPTPTSTPTPVQPTPEPPALATPADIQHGNVYWGVYFANAPQEAPEFKDAQSRTKTMGLEIFHKDPNCDVPVGEGPPAPAAPKAENYVISVYFETEADARATATAYGDPAPWVGQVKTMCLD